MCRIDPKYINVLTQVFNLNSPMELELITQQVCQQSEGGSVKTFPEARGAAEG